MKRSTVVRALYLLTLLCALACLWLSAVSPITGRDRDAAASSRMRVIPAHRISSDIYSIAATVMPPFSLVSPQKSDPPLNPFFSAYQLLSGGSLRLREEIDGQVALIVNVASQ
jgi:hypothetical protein